MKSPESNEFYIENESLDFVFLHFLQCFSSTSFFLDLLQLWLFGTTWRTKSSSNRTVWKDSFLWRFHPKRGEHNWCRRCNLYYKILSIILSIIWISLLNILLFYNLNFCFQGGCCSAFKVEIHEEGKDEVMFLSRHGTATDEDEVWANFECSEPVRYIQSFLNGL